jgi:ankyrin repeat protein
MKNYLRISGASSIKAIFFIVVMFCVLFMTTESYAAFSPGPRQTGDEVLRELLMGSNRFVVSVGSNGCTDKSSFKVDVKKEEGLSAKAPHYVLTVRRIKPDECKSIVADGILVLFDLGKDLGITGDFTYSLTNRVFASSRVQPSDESLTSIIEKYFTPGFSETKEIKPEPDKTAEAESPSESLRLYLDSGKGDPNVVKRLIEQGADVNTRDEDLITPLHNAIHYKHAEAAKVLISHGADVNARNVEENTPLYVAVHQEQEEVVRYLLGKVAEVNAANKFGYTPLRESCRWGDPAIVELLIAQGADVNVKDKKGDSPIHIAVDDGHVDALKVLLDHGADINAIGTFGDAPIHSAVARGYTEIVKLLVSKGADLTLKDRRGHSPMDIAVVDDNREIIDLLKKRGDII